MFYPLSFLKKKTKQSLRFLSFNPQISGVERKVSKPKISSRIFLQGLRDIKKTTSTPPDYIENVCQVKWKSPMSSTGGVVQGPNFAAVTCCTRK